MARSYARCMFSFFKKLPNLLSGEAVSFYILTAMHDSLFLHILTNT